MSITQWLYLADPHSLTVAGAAQVAGRNPVPVSRFTLVACGDKRTVNAAIIVTFPRSGRCKRRATAVSGGYNPRHYAVTALAGTAAIILRGYGNHG